MTNIGLHEIAMALAIMITAFSQLLLKSGASGQKTWLASFLNWKTMTGYVMFGMVTVLNVFAMQKIQLKIMAAWIALTYILVVVLSRYILKEYLCQTQIIGCLLIGIGILVFSL